MEDWLRSKPVHGSQFLGSLFAGFANELAAIDAEAMLAWAESLKKLETGPKFPRAYSLAPSKAVGNVAAQHLVEADFERAKQLAEGGSAFLTEPVAARLAEVDLTAAVEWLKEQSGGALDHKAAGLFEPAINALPFSEAVAFLQKYPLRFAAGHYVAAKETIPTSQVAAMPSSALRDEMLGAVLMALSAAEPEQAVRSA